MSQALLFVDAIGGALASLGAAVARSLGHSDAMAATTGPEGELPREIPTVLAEVGMSVASVSSFEAAHDRDKRLVIWIGEAEPPDAIESPRVIVASLYEGEGEFEKLCTARVVRDRIERHLAEIIAPR